MDESTVKTPTPQEIELELLQRRFEGRLAELTQDLRSARSLVSEKNSQIVRLEAENLRLKMTRTDRELSTQIDGLRTEVGKKDRELVELRRQIEKFVENEKVILHRAAVADQKVATVQNTLVTMQRSRDAAQAETEKHDRARAEAVTQMIAAADRARRAEERLAELEKKTTVRKK
jgi:chromosome segregation ATPase